MRIIFLSIFCACLMTTGLLADDYSNYSNSGTSSAMKTYKTVNAIKGLSRSIGINRSIRQPVIENKPAYAPANFRPGMVPSFQKDLLKNTNNDKMNFQFAPQPSKKEKNKIMKIESDKGGLAGQEIRPPSVDLPASIFSYPDISEKNK